MRGRWFEVPFPVFLVFAVAVVGGLLWGMLEYAQREEALHVDARLTFFDNAPRIRAWNDLGWRQGTPKMLVQEGLSIFAASSGRTTVSVAEASSLRLAPGTHIEMMHLRKSPTGTRAHIRLCRGRLWVEQGDKYEYVVRSDAGDIECQGGAVEIEVTSQDTQVRTWKGVARYVGALVTPSRQVKAERQLLIPLGRPMAESTLPVVDDWTAWNLAITAEDVAAGALPPVLAAAERRRALLASRATRPARSESNAPVEKPKQAPPDARPETTVAMAPLPASRGGRPPLVQPPPASPWTPPPSPPRPGAATGNRDGIATPGAALKDGGPTSKRVSQSRSTWRAPDWLTRKGAPNLAYRTEQSLMSFDTYSQAAVNQAYQRVSSLLSQRFNMTLRKPISIHVVGGDDYRNLRSSYYHVELLQCDSEGRQHESYIIGGLHVDQCYSCLGHAHAYAWYAENARTRTSSSDTSAFCLWMQYKTLAELGAIRDAAAMTSKSAVVYGNVRYSEALAQMLTLERDYGEYGVFHTVISGYPQDL